MFVSDKYFAAIHSNLCWDEYQTLISPTEE